MEHITTPYVCIDVDGVLLDLNKTLESYLKKKSITFYPEKIERYDFSGDIGCDKKLCFEAFSDQLFWKEQLKHPLSDLSKVANALKEEGYNPYIYTLFNYSEEIKDIRRQYIASKNVTEYAIYDSEKPVLLEASALFEDCLGNIKRWMEEGFEGDIYLIDQTYNQEGNNKDFPYFDKIIRVNNLEQGVEMFLGKMKEQEAEHSL
jgi:uncharacterized HAD superfamily protein